MIDNEYLQEDYEQFLRYVEGTWTSFFDVFNEDIVDLKEGASIEKIIVHGYKNNFKVFVYLKGNPVYYIIKDGDLVEVTYEGKPIKTEYCLNDELMLYMLLKGTFVEDLGLTDVPFHLWEFVEGIEVDTGLSKKLENAEQDYAEAMYCMEHDY